MMADDDPLKSLQCRLKGWTHVFESIERNTEIRRPDYRVDHKPLSTNGLEHNLSDKGLGRTASTSSSSKTLTAQCPNSVYHTVLYDHDAQSQLTEMVKDVCLTAKELRTSSCQASRDMDVKLRPVAELCEKMAYQLLLDGGCQPHLNSIIRVLEDMARVCQKHYYSSSVSLANVDRLPQVSSASSDKTCHLNATSIERETNDDDDDDDDDDSDDESDRKAILASIRLTSRMKAI